MWIMLYADDVGIISRSTRGLARVMTVIVVEYQEFGRTVSEYGIHSMCLWSILSSAETALHIKTADPRYK